ncbi:YdcH family protein [Kiloniella sp. b19]|uniref:YdcH family protein n=1 Tax=Kiloniella sp. GXU_MW_B19 TaxID=3141326 RepID=UPI0031DA4292
MATTDRVIALRAKHHNLEAEIDKEKQRPYPNDNYISEMKRAKLKIKDEIATLHA